MDFSRQSTYKFIYNPEKYKPETSKIIDDYIDFVRSLKELLNDPDIDKEEIIALDKQRYQYHMDCAKKLVQDEICSSLKLAKGFARIILISRGLDTYNDAYIPDMERLKRVTTQDSSQRY